MDKIFIQGLETHTTIGIYDFEKAKPQRLILELEAGYQNPAAQTDRIEDALNYAAIYEAILDFCQNHSYELLEAFGENLAQQLLQDFSMRWIRLRLNKPDILPQCQGVGIEIYRESN